MIEVDITINGYSRKEKWYPTEIYCPECGKHRVYEKSDEDDYYVGTDHFCLDCTHKFTIQSSYSCDDQKKQLVTQILKNLNG